MKYMGSKRWMLSNGLGHLIEKEIRHANRFVDLFTGSGAVAKHAADRFEKPVYAYDLQCFCVTLAAATITRTQSADAEAIWTRWLSEAKSWIAQRRLKLHSKQTIPGIRAGFTRKFVSVSQQLASDIEASPITNAYGGYYFSVSQSLWLDALRATIPTQEPERSIALAALIHASSECAAAPGHTAQPFKCTLGAREYLHNAWARSVLSKTHESLTKIANTHARTSGAAILGDANLAANDLQERDLVFLDPPYSGVHYSRFYHVLETVARGTCGPVFGEGRYPPQQERPRSKFSVTSESQGALSELFRTVASKGATAILTFPKRACSNGLSGRLIEEIASEFFRVESFVKYSTFSTLGGTRDGDGKGYGRRGRQKTHEIIFTLRPK